MSKKEKKFFRQCPDCDNQIGHTQEKNRDAAEKLNKTCNSCSKKGKPCPALAYNQSIRNAHVKLYGEKHKLPHNKLVKWAKAIKTRDNYTCARCDTVATGYNINAHHVIPKEYFPEKAFDISNGVTLCAPCHNQVHADLERVTLSGTKLTPVGFQEHAARFIAEGNASSQSTQNPHGYKPVFQPMITSHKE